MARHSHWAQIKLKKGALDKKRGKIFSKHAHLLEVAARGGGGDPDMNPSLRIAIDNARADNMPKENIERAIKKGTGELKGGAELQEVVYEGYGPGGVALIIETLTDNKNRTNQTVRTILQKFEGNLGEAGCTSFMFETKGMIEVRQKENRESDQLEIIDAGAEDIREMEGGFVVSTAPKQLTAVRDALQKKGFSVVSAELTKVPKTVVSIDQESAKKLVELIETLQDEEDVTNVAANVDF